MRPTNPVKLTVEIDQELYNSVSAKLHHGQISQMIRRIMVEIDTLLKSPNKKEFHDWLYSSGELNLGGNRDEPLERVRPNGEDSIS
jgi:hypothetical protein